MAKETNKNGGKEEIYVPSDLYKKVMKIMEPYLNALRMYKRPQAKEGQQGSGINQEPDKK
jgi:hypothetical protein